MQTGWHPAHYVSTVLLTSLLAVAPAALSIAGPPLSTTKPNFVVILADDMGWGDPSCYPQQRWRPGGALDTPEIDRLAASGVKCMQAYATSPICNPSRAGLLTGRYQQHFGYYEFHEALAEIPKTVPTVAELLKKQGYATAIYGKWHSSFRVEDGPLTRGFDQFYGFIGGQHDYYNPRIGELVNGVGFSDGAFLWNHNKELYCLRPQVGHQRLHILALRLNPCYHRPKSTSG